MKRLIKFELRKIFMKRITQLAIVVVLLLSALLSFSTYQNKHASDGAGNEGSGRMAVKVDKAIAAKYEGILTDDTVRQILSDFAPKIDLNGLNAKYLYQNSMQSAAAARFSDSDGNWNGLTVSDVFGNEEIKIGYIDGWLSVSQNMVRIYLFLSFAVVIMIAPVFSGEYGGVDNIILSSKYGKTKCASVKAAAGFIAVTMVTAFVVIINTLAAFVMYGGDGLDCSILFSTLDFAESYIPFNITCGTLLKYQVLLAFTGAISAAGITMLLSAVCKNQMITLVSSATIYILPVILPVTETNPVFRLLVLLPLYHSQFISIMSVEQMKNGTLYAIYAIPVAVVLAALGTFISHKAFAKHQVS